MKRLNYKLGKRSTVVFCLMTVLAISTQLASAQQKLSLEEAISVALKNNYDIKRAHNDTHRQKNK
jgi:outer membrane protein